MVTLHFHFWELCFFHTVTQLLLRLQDCFPEMVISNSGAALKTILALYTRTPWALAFSWEKQQTTGGGFGETNTTMTELLWSLVWMKAFSVVWYLVQIWTLNIKKAGFHVFIILLILIMLLMRIHDIIALLNAKSFIVLIWIIGFIISNREKQCSMLLWMNLLPLCTHFLWMNFRNVSLIRKGSGCHREVQQFSS